MDTSLLLQDSLPGNGMGRLSSSTAAGSQNNFAATLQDFSAADAETLLAGEAADSDAELPDAAETPLALRLPGSAALLQSALSGAMQDSTDSADSAVADPDPAADSGTAELLPAARVLPDTLARLPAANADSLATEQQQAALPATADTTADAAVAAAASAGEPGEQTENREEEDEPAQQAADNTAALLLQPPLQARPLDSNHRSQRSSADTGRNSAQGSNLNLAGLRQPDLAAGSAQALAAQNANSDSRDFSASLLDVEAEAAALLQDQPAPAGVDLEAIQQTLNALRLAEPANGSSNLRSAAAASDSNWVLHSDIEAGSHGWSEEIGSRISWLKDQGISKAELSLHPAELGVLDITIHSEDDRISVSIVTRNEAARELLQDSLPRLADLLRGSGLALEQGAVSQQDSSQRDMARSSQQGTAAPAGDQHDSNDTTANIRPRSALLHQGRIDHYV
jgi:flagellar hook-length control protein FliK